MSKTAYTVVSFYTPNWEYPARAARLRASCERLGLPHVIEEWPDLGGWIANGCQKPAFILSTMEKLQRPLLWLDVDNELVSVPTGLRGGVDFMAVARPKEEGKRFYNRRGWDWCVWAMLFNPTPGALNLLRWWRDETAGATDGDDPAFDRVWKRHRDELRGAALPSEYAKKDNGVVRWGKSTWSVKKKDLAAFRATRDPAPSSRRHRR